MRIDTPYPKKRLLNSDTKLTILIVLWVLDKIAMIILLWIFNYMTSYCIISGENAVILDIDDAYCTKCYKKEILHVKFKPNRKTFNALREYRKRMEQDESKNWQ